MAAPEAVQSLIESLVQPGGRLFLVVLDGLGGLPHPETGLTELESARTPNLDELAREASLGLLTPIAPGVTPGSAPAHLALFGYDPIEYQIGRGVLSAVGVGAQLEAGDVAARVNFATLQGGVVTDRRAGRIDTAVAERLCQKLNDRMNVPGVRVEFRAEMQHRAVMVLRGSGLHPALSESDPQVPGRPPLEVVALEEEAAQTAAIVNEIIQQAAEILADEHPANGILVRGFGRLPEIPSLQKRFGLNPAVAAYYPMYRGLAQLVGMKALPVGPEAEDAVAAVEAAGEFDYVFMHLKATDAAGEDGDFDRKVAAIEGFDALLPRILGVVDRERDVLVVTGDHSTPAVMKMHSWHPVPVLLASPYARRDGRAQGFGERSCAHGSLGMLRSQDLLAVMLAHAGRLRKFGA